MGKKMDSAALEIQLGKTHFWLLKLVRILRVADRSEINAIEVAL